MPDLNYLDLSLESWTPLLLAVGLAIVVATAVFLVGSRIVMRAVGKSPAATAVARAVRAPASVLLPLLATTSVIHSAEDGLSGLPTVQRLLLMLTIATVTWLLSRAISGYGRSVIDANHEALGDNLEARRIHTQTRVLTRTLNMLIMLVGLSLALMTIPSVRQVGASLLASAGVIGIVAGFAARPVLGNLIAGLQIGLAQPIRIQDVVIVENEWGVIEEIRGTYVVVRIWDDRRLVVPLQYWVEKPFQNWTRTAKQLTGTVTMWVDYRMPMAPLREALRRACESCDKWDRRTCLLQVTEAGERAIQVRALVTAADAGQAWDLRCHVREALVDFVQREYPQYLPQFRIDSLASPAPAATAEPVDTTETAAVSPPRGTS